MIRVLPEAANCTKGLEKMESKMELNLLEYEVEGMSCPKCGQKIRKALSAMPAVKSAELAAGSKRVLVTQRAYDASLEDVRQQIEQIREGNFSVLQVTNLGAAGGRI